MGTTTKVVDRTYLTKQFKNFNDTLVKPGLEDLDDRKVDKVPGKGLSKNDFTDALKTKLEGLENVELETEPIDFYTLDSDEFTYTKTPGTISKLFVHLVKGNTSDESVSIDNNVALDDDHKAVYVDSDGVKRYDVEINGNSSDGYTAYIEHSDIDYIAVFDVEITANSNLDSILDAFNDTNNKESLLNAIKKDCEENDVEYRVYDGNSGSYVVDKNGFYDDNISPNESATEADFIDQLISERIHQTTGVYDSDRTSTEKGYNGLNINIIGSNDIETGIFDTGWGTLEIPKPYRNSSWDCYSYTIGNCIDPDSYSSGGAKPGTYGNWIPSNDYSQGFNGLPIIAKALEEGRALDLALFVEELGRQSMYM